jgi:glucose/mannose-6-phosphate isomerase
MQEAIENFPKQFLYNPVIENKENWKQFQRFVVIGMGGSHLQGDIVQTLLPSCDIRLHKDYGLPARIPAETLFVINSYSGNTQEAISAFEQAIAQKLPVVVTATGGKLLALAKKHTVPYIQIPDTNIQPRSALGLTVKALLKVIGEEELLAKSSELAEQLNASGLQEQGKVLAQKLYGKVPVVYSSQRNFALAYNWKIKFNETGKIPAFYNVFPELNHNEMAGFGNAELNKPFFVIILHDKDDDPRIQKRMQVLAKQYAQKGLPVSSISLEGPFALLKLFSSLLFADWVAYHTALLYGADPEQVPMIEEFKKQIG